MVLSTLFGDGRARLAGSNYGNFVVFQVSFKFLLFLSYFVKPSRESIKQSITMVQARFCRIQTTRFSEIRQQISVTCELLNQTTLKTVLLKKQINITRAVLEYCTGRFVTSAPWESTLPNNLNKGRN